MDARQFHIRFTSSNNQSKLILGLFFLTFLLTSSNCYPIVESTNNRTGRHLGFGKGMGLSFSESMAMAGNSNFGFGNNGAMSMSEAMAMDAGIKNVNGFPMPYFDMSMSEAAAGSTNFQFGR